MKRAIIILRLEPQLKELIKQEAIFQRRDMTSFILTVLDDYFEEKNGK